jgi:hypothetical protein
MSPHGRPKGEFPRGGLSVDMSLRLRVGECLAKRPGMQARPWTLRDDSLSRRKAAASAVWPRRAAASSNR